MENPSEEEPGASVLSRTIADPSLERDGKCDPAFRVRGQRLEAVHLSGAERSAPGTLGRWRLQPRATHSHPELTVLPQPEMRHWVPADAQELGRETVDTRLLMTADEDSLISMMSLSRVWLS